MLSQRRKLRAVDLKLAASFAIVVGRSSYEDIEVRILNASRCFLKAFCIAQVQ